VRRHVKDASASAYARNIDLIVCTGKHQAWCKAHTEASEAHGHLQSLRASQVGREWIVRRRALAFRYTCRFVVEESPEMQAWRITCQRVCASFAFPTAAPLPVPCQFLRSAANKAAAWVTSRGQSCIVKTIMFAVCVANMGADRLWYGLDVNGERRRSYGVDERPWWV
jgi:hypothetical protein